MIEWFACLSSICGNFLNIKKSAWGFVFWIVGNTIWIVVDYQQQKWANMTLFVVYNIMSLYGLYEWTRPIKGKTNNKTIRRR